MLLLYSWKRKQSEKSAAASILSRKPFILCRITHTHKSEEVKNNFHPVLHSTPKHTLVYQLIIDKLTDGMEINVWVNKKIFSGDHIILFLISFLRHSKDRRYFYSNCNEILYMWLF